MKTNRLPRLLSLSATLLALASTASAQTLVRYESQPGSKMRLDGTSNIHDWHAESQLIGGYVEVDGALIESPDKLKLGKVAAKAETFVAVRSLKCSSGSKMDEVMQEAMKAKENPRIAFKLAELSLKEAKGAQVSLEAKGSLTVSGVTKDITFPLTLHRRVDTSRATFTGTAALKMTDFGIKPPAPAAGAGLIKTGDEVKLTFEWAVAKKEAGK
jgi:polyisoprenoid-binding protein YceI